MPKLQLNNALYILAKSAHLLIACHKIETVKYSLASSALESPTPIYSGLVGCRRKHHHKTARTY